MEKPSAPARSASRDDGGHGLDVVAVGGLVARPALAHHVGTHCAVGNLDAHVDGLGHGLHGVEELGEGLPSPADPRRQRRAGDVLDPLHEPDEPVVTVGTHGREADPAVARDHGGDAVPARRREKRVPGDLAVVVGVDVHEPGCDERPVGVDLSLAAPCDLSHLDHDATAHGDIGGARRGPGAVDDRSPPDDQVVHGPPPPPPPPDRHAIEEQASRRPGDPTYQYRRGSMFPLAATLASPR